MKKKKSIYIRSESDMVLMSDPLSHSAIISSLKRAFSRGPTVVNFLKKHRREEIWFKKDGTKAVKPHVFYKCAECQKEFNSVNIQVDHINPVVPLNIPSKHLSYSTLIDRLFCEESNLQILCKEHHKEKSQKENIERKEWIAKTKFIVYETINRINNKKYIGVHKTSDYDDFYLGSGLALKKAIEKYGKKAFYRHILYTYDNAIDAYNKEKELVNTELVEDEQYYNLVPGGKGGFPDHVAEDNKIKIICFETGQIFNSISEAEKIVGVSGSSISRALNKNDVTVKDLHFFTLDAYSKDIEVTYPTLGEKLIHLNTGKLYENIELAANDLELNYKSLRNALSDQKDNEYCQLYDECFVRFDKFDKNKIYKMSKIKIKCIELNKEFDSAIQAAEFIKHKKPAFGAIAINKAIRNKTKAYKYNWINITKIVALPLK